MTRYVVGFLFDQARKRLVLIRKNKPDWQRGKLNGVGGKIESGETPAQAMRREFLEEAGVDLEDWTEFATMTGTGFAVHFFCMFVDCRVQESVCSMTAEAVCIFDIPAVPSLDTIPNVQWLIPMALSMQYDKTAAAFFIEELAA